ncbi:MAG: 6-carboxytetrahydropterin synthase, partial [Thermoanaerobaculia bacterium]
MPYLLRVRHRFEAAHHLTSYKGSPEPVHGHSWR